MSQDESSHDFFPDHEISFELTLYCSSNQTMDNKIHG